ncbi:MAG: glycosyltransferase family 2 protein [Chitinispirillaceae bacterium]|nr:glycosyltransferase family 2 protein [Chitinispirillaceae bacterium]
MLENVLTVIINYQTPDLIELSAGSFRNFYPSAKLMIIDNGSKDNSLEVINKIKNSNPFFTTTILLDKNIFHGPAMHLALTKAKESFVFFLDSDTEIHKGGFLELMLKEFDCQETYGIGKIQTLNRRGFPSSKGIDVPMTAFMMIKREIYFRFPPFEHHGAPILKNFTAAQKEGFKFKHFPIEEFIEHKHRGTASRFGYGLGLKAKFDYVLNKLGL